MFNNLPNKKLVAWGVVVLVIVVLFAAKWLKSEARAKSLSVVYLSSQEIYVGHLQTFPRMVLTDAYILQNVQPDPKVNKTDLQLFPLSSKPWAPTSITLNREQVLFYGPLNENSEAFKGIMDKESKK